MVGADHLKTFSGNRFFYRIQKSPKTSSHSVLFALHGFMGDHRSLSPALSNISTCDVIYVDLPLFGKSELPAPISTFYQYAEYLADQIREISKNYDHAFLCGYSMGGRIALYLLIHFQDFFSGGVLESAQPGVISESEREKRRHLEKNWMTQISEDFSGFLNYWSNLEILKPSKSLSEEHEQLLESIQKHQHPAQLIRSLQITGTGQMPSLWENLKNISLPLLLVSGEDDEKYAEITRQMKSRLVDAESVIFPNCGHRVHLDQPQKLAEKITQFTEQHTLI